MEDEEESVGRNEEHTRDSRSLTAIEKREEGDWLLTNYYLLRMMYKLIFYINGEKTENDILPPKRICAFAKCQ